MDAPREMFSFHITDFADMKYLCVLLLVKCKKVLFNSLVKKHIYY